MRPIHLLSLAAIAVASSGLLPDHSSTRVACAGTHATTVRSSSGDGFHYGSWSDDTDGTSDRFQYAIVEPGAHESMSVSDEDGMSSIARVQEEARRTGKTLFWFRKDGRSYLVRDPALTERASKIVAPMQELGAEQGRLGAQQGRWGAMQGRLGALQGRIGAMQARIAVASMGAGDRDDAELADLRRQVRELGDEARELSAQQGGLGARQGELGARQGELGRKQAAASKVAWKDLKALASDALASGRAEKF